MLAEKVSFPEAVRMVAEKCGVPIPAIPGPEDKKFEERQRLFEIYERAASYLHHKLPADEAAPARQVLEKRQIQPQYIERFRLGYAPAAGLLNYLRLKDALDSGLFVNNDSVEV